MNSSEITAYAEIYWIVCTSVSAALGTVNIMPRFEPIYSPSALTAMLLVPLITTNVLATALICYRAWCAVSVDLCLKLLIVHNL